MIRLSGWRRLGALLAVLLFVGCASLAAVEWLGKQTGMFVYRTPAAGTTIDVLKNQVVLPGGKVVNLNQSFNGREPWELDWDKEPEAAPVLVLNWKRILKLGLLLPFAVWLAIEGIAFATRWIAKAFRMSREEVR